MFVQTFKSIGRVVPEKSLTENKIHTHKHRHKHCYGKDKNYAGSITNHGTTNKYTQTTKDENKRQKECLWKHTADKKMGVSVLLRLFISSNEVCNTAYTL